MNIAIIGAGLSGLSCALILERYGIKPDIYEKRSEVEDRFINCEILLNILNHPLPDCIKYLNYEHDIYLRPQNYIDKMFIHSENHQAEFKGNIGYTNLRGRTSTSFGKQLANMLNDSKITFNSDKEYEELKEKYSHVILATGDAEYAIKLDNYIVELTVTLKGSLIKGKFNPNTVRTWFNNKLVPQGYGYLIPINENKANLVIGYPEKEKNKNIDTEYLWNNFLYEVSRDLEQTFNILTHFEVNNYIIGLCKKPVLDNMYFVGNNFGSIMPFLGFGQIESILTGIYAAYDIIGIDSYIKLTQPLKTSNKDSLILRNYLEKLDNNKLDLLIRLMDKIPGKILFQNRIGSLKILSRLLSLFPG